MKAALKLKLTNYSVFVADSRTGARTYQYEILE